MHISMETDNIQLKNFDRWSQPMLSQWSVKKSSYVQNVLHQRERDTI